MTCRSSTVLMLAALSASLVLVGCSDRKKGFVLKGSVAYQGKPLTSGIVRLHMAENRMAMAMIQPDGSFEATDVFPGEAKVTVEEDPTVKQRKMMPAPAGAPKAPTVVKQVSVLPVPIPAQYKDANTSGLNFNLKPGTPLHIELK